MRGLSRGHSIDLVHDRASRETGDKIRCPLLAVWGKSGKIEKRFDALAIWREYLRERRDRRFDRIQAIISPRKIPPSFFAWFNRFF